MDSGVEMNGDTGSNRNSYCSAADSKDIALLETSTLKDTSSSETITDQSKKRTTTTAKKSGNSTATKKRVAGSEKVASKSSPVKARIGSGKARPSTDRSTSSAKTTSSSVFDRLSSGRASVIRATSKESVVSQDSSAAAESRKVSGASKLALNRVANQTATDRKKVNRRPETADSSKVTSTATGTPVRRSASSVTSSASRPKARTSATRRSAIINSDTAAATTPLGSEDKSSFLKKMLTNKASSGSKALQ